jgi:hypothetical protein
VRNAAIIAYTLSLKSVVSLPSTRLLRQNREKSRFESKTTEGLLESNRKLGDRSSSASN